ncbi:hypothetical protein EYF80_010389 [Liparis tanakae]|uniref:Uncharacterized protein n=1 Tax=Liparis tanakae TaxID=230148 RepID=A0A4Z2IND4_9TELE|nr:hypothetical protein EYF80_010389 [Liparis tanakae]
MEEKARQVLMEEGGRIRAFGPSSSQGAGVSDTAARRPDELLCLFALLVLLSAAAIQIRAHGTLGSQGVPVTITIPVHVKVDAPPSGPCVYGPDNSVPTSHSPLPLFLRCIPTIALLPGPIALLQRTGLETARHIAVPTGFLNSVTTPCAPETH